MMRYAIILCCILLFTGCTTDETERFKTWLTDPHYKQHQQKLDELEQSYLKGQLSYSEYTDRKNQLEETYIKEVQEREHKIHD